ncbi:MAG: aquaporin [Candidatus Micrarchaeia archaeon]
MEKSHIAEFIGTFALVFIGAGAVLVNGLTGGAVGLVGIAFAHGLVLLAMIYTFASLSGSHFNPAVTLALLAGKRIGPAKAAGYIACQLLGAAAASFLLMAMYPEATPAQLYGLPTGISMGLGIAIEAVLTFFLVLTVYGVAVDRKAPAGVFGWAIGGVIVCDILMGGTQTGATMNPARAFGPALASGMLGNQPIYWLGPIIGAIIAGFVSEYLQKEEAPKKEVPKKK